MKALTWHSKNDIRGDSVPDPKIEHGRDAIIKVTACAICGSNLHLFDGGASWSVYDFLRRVLLLQKPELLTMVKLGQLRLMR
jgi:threonine dehydrogenase-like Zn-dependent dehydrogenase